MEYYNKIKEYYKSTLLFKLSSIGYALECNLALTNRLELLPFSNTINLIDELKDNDKLFIDLSIIPNEYVCYIYNKIKEKNIKLNFYLMTEPNVNPQIIELLLPISHKIYCLNNNYLHPNVYYMPIGIRDCYLTIKPIHKDFYHIYLFNEGLKKVEKEYLCIIGGMGNTHTDRNICFNELKDKSYIYNLSNLNYDINFTKMWGTIPVYELYKFINKSHYVIAPRGVGVDTHRFFEALYLKSIPIVKKTNTVFDKLYEHFPCLVVDEWLDITEELLLSNLNNLKEKINNFFIKYPNAFTDISTIEGLLIS
jgi:hypothetical protein